jgi:hypothetical protein
VTCTDSEYDQRASNPAVYAREEGKVMDFSALWAIHACGVGRAPLELASDRYWPYTPNQQVALFYVPERPPKARP